MAESAQSPPNSSTDAQTAVLLKQFGVILLKNALSAQEQEKLYNTIKPQIKDCKMTPSNFHVSSGAQGSNSRIEDFHVLGNKLFTKCADAIQNSLNDNGNDANQNNTNKNILTQSDVERESSFARLNKVSNSKSPANVESVCGVAYKNSMKLDNHVDMAGTNTDGKPFFTMSLALGCSCEFSVGKKTRNPTKFEKNGEPVTLLMESGDALFFDGGSVPHAVDKIVSGSGPDFWKKQAPKGYDRVSVLFREGIGK